VFPAEVQRRPGTALSDGWIEPSGNLIARMPPWNLMRYRGTSRSLEAEGEGGVEDKVDPLEWTWMDFFSFCPGR